VSDTSDNLPSCHSEGVILSAGSKEKVAAFKAIGRYNGLLIKQGVEETGSVLKDFSHYCDRPHYKICIIKIL
jgi:hypothetical protein